MKKPNIVYVLKRCIEGNKAYGGFPYGEKGSTVEAKDWSDAEGCGNGLHGWTDKFDVYFDDELKGNFVVIKVDKNDGFTELGDKVKFRKGVIMHNGNFEGAKKIMVKKYPDMRLHWDTNRQGNGSTNRQGNGSTNTQGYGSTNRQGNGSTNKQGDDSINRQGYNSINKQWDDSINKQGEGSTNKQGNRSTNTIYGNSNILKCMSDRHATVMFYYDKMRVFQGGIDYREGETVYIEDMSIVKKYTTTPDNITSLEKHEIIVFGSNGDGNHCGGLAKVCKERFGATQGVAEGLQGQSYAINTMDGIDKIRDGLQELKRFATQNTNKIILLTKIGQGIAGYTGSEIRQLVEEIDFPANVVKWY